MVQFWIKSSFIPLVDKWLSHRSTLVFRKSVLRITSAFLNNHIIENIGGWRDMFCNNCYQANQYYFLF